MQYFRSISSSPGEIINAIDNDNIIKPGITGRMN